ncbi:MAG: Lrp/AsnC family transcriptional regulator [Nitrososphaerota archaeon]
MVETALDEKDLEIIRALMKDAKKSFTELSRELGVPRTTLQERFRRITSRGVIKRIAAIPDYSRLGLPATAFLLVSFSPVMDISQRDLAAMIAEMEHVYEVHLISGQWDMLIKVRAPSTEEVGRLVIDKIRSIKNVAKTETCFVFHTAKEVP